MGKRACSRSEKEKRPELSVDMDVSALRDYYWLKEELLQFCKKNGIPASGKKLEILARIEVFLKTGKIGKPKKKKRGKSRADSEKPLSLDTPVINFKSDQKTREFFESAIGPHFHFTAHLNQFRRENDNLTYGDLVSEWLAEKERRKNGSYRAKIMKSCEYNQFIRDFFADENNQGKSFQDAVAAWNEIKKKHGPRKYVPQST